MPSATFLLGVVREGHDLGTGHVIVGVVSLFAVVSLSLILSAVQANGVSDGVNALIMRLKMVTLLGHRHDRVQMVTDNVQDVVVRFMGDLIGCKLVPNGI